MRNDLYRAFWRWHFYAGLIALPFLVWLAVTGGLYLFKPEIEQAVYGEWITLPEARTPQSLSAIVARVEQQTGGRVKQLQVPADHGESWRINYSLGRDTRTAFVDPQDGRVLGTTTKGGVTDTIKNLHSLAITGKLGNALVEVAAGWAIILVVTGIALWWPRQGQPALALRGPTKSRRFWRDLHASTGAIACLIVLFLAVTGMPWSVFWGTNVQKVIAAEGIGRPEPPRGVGGHESHGAAPVGDRKQALPWSMQATPMPMTHGNGDVGVDRVQAIAVARGLVAPYTLNVAEGSKPYQLTRIIGRVEDTRVMYIEPSSGRVLQDAAEHDFGVGAKAIEWGVQTHQGQQYPPMNRWIMLAGCLAILALAISAPMLWWKRRDAGRLVLPPQPRNDKRTGIATAMAAVLGFIFPLTGATVLAVLLIDVNLQRRKASASG